MTLASPVRAPAMVAIPPGTYLMGGVAEDKFVSAVELPRHSVTIQSGFALGTTPVTCSQWMEMFDSLPSACAPELAGNCPVVGVTHADTQRYLHALSARDGISYRLPTEAEWEYACRASGPTVFPNGTRLTPADANFLYDENGDPIGLGKLTPVACYPANAFGLFDMLGNVCEWTSDIWHPGFDGAPTDGSARTTGGKPGYRAIRGGAWDHLPRVLRSSWRDWAPDSARWDNLGFRIAYTI
ncbi:MAG: formylglycine-generating enzyme family protein [Akkermansiaceae bacterium]